MNASRNRGLAAVELALIIPVFLMLLIGTEELGRALYQYNTLTKAVRDAAQYLARYGTVAGYVAPTTAQKTVATNLIVYGAPALPTACAGDPTACQLLPGTAPTVTITLVTVPPALGPTFVNVQADYTFFRLFTVIPAFSFGSGVTVPGTFSASITMAGVGT